MSTTKKEFDLFAWRKNDISVLAVSQENKGRQIVFNLYENDLNKKLLNKDSVDYDVYFYVNLSSNSSAYVCGEVDKINSKVSFKIESNLVPKQGRYPCFISLVYGETIIKVGGMNLMVLDGDTSNYSDTVRGTNAFDMCLAKVAELEVTINEAIEAGNKIADLNKYTMEYVTEVKTLSADSYVVDEKKIAKNSPVVISISRGGGKTTLVRADDEKLIDQLTGKIVDATMTNVEVKVEDVLIGIKLTEGGTLTIKYYNKNCEDLLRRINNIHNGSKGISVTHNVDNTTTQSKAITAEEAEL